MNARRVLLLIVVISVYTLAACNWTIGDCYPVGERTSGAGAGPGSEPSPIYTSAASGDFGAEPPEGPYDGSERKIACNESDLEDEEEEDARPTNSPESPRDECFGVGDLAGDGATSWGCSDACSSKCPPPGMASFLYVNFEPSDFLFVTTVQDDGRGKAGGYQVAKANLKFTYTVVQRGARSTTEWYCPLTIQMPLRTEFMGKIDPIRAATLSEEITEDVANRMDYNLPPGIFCHRFRLDVDATFKVRYPLLGASVSK
ncbi:hypothetical protein [Sorangium sp. So ce1182]|uniref:hypothetical protein n=1 Tax=Sorangium sp. So ce1182 TaxID=3133334 RepID=UPI003F60E4BD